MIQEHAGNVRLERVCRDLRIWLSNNVHYQRALARGVFNILPLPVTPAILQDQALLARHHEEWGYLINTPWFVQDFARVRFRIGDTTTGPEPWFGWVELYKWINTLPARSVLLTPKLLTQRHGNFLCWITLRQPWALWGAGVYPTTRPLITAGLKSAISQGCMPMICLLGHMKYETFNPGLVPRGGRPLNLLRDPPHAYHTQNIPASRWKKLKIEYGWPYESPRLHAPEHFWWMDWVEILDHAMSCASHYPILLSSVIEMLFIRLEQTRDEDILTHLPHNGRLLSVAERSISNPLLFGFQGRVEELLTRIWTVLPPADTIHDEIWELTNWTKCTVEPLRRSLWMWMEPGLYPNKLVMRRIDGKVDWQVKTWSSPGMRGSHYC